MITEPVQLALVVAVPTFVAPIILLIANRWLDRGDKRRQYAREDEVALRAAETAEFMKRSTTMASSDRAEIKNQVKAVHTLVNSDKTALIENNLAALEGQLAALKRLESIGRKLTPPLKSTDEEVTAMNNLRSRIEAVKKTLKEREEQTVIVKEQLAQGTAAIETDMRQAIATERVADETKRIADVAEAPKAPK